MAGPIFVVELEPGLWINNSNFCGCLSKIGNELFVDTGLCQEGEVEHALNSARSARFEHGEQP